VSRKNEEGAKADHSMTDEGYKGKRFVIRIGTYPEANRYIHLLIPLTPSCCKTNHRQLS
jgi:hypothetical protein